MTGKHRIIVQNKRVRYDFEVKRNITVIRGDSATGKTTLLDMVREYYLNGKDSGIELKCDKVCTFIEGRTWANQLSTMKDSIVFIDEGNDFVLGDEFATTIKATDNYYIIVAREGIPSLPYSVEEIYGIRNSGKYGGLKRTYNEFYHIYNMPANTQSVSPDCLIVEDSNSGYQYFDNVCRNEGHISCVSAEGKTKIFAKTLEYLNDNVLIIADGAAFGSEMEKLMGLVSEHPNITVYLSESFEWLILNSGIVDIADLNKILDNTEDYVESSKFFSWERFFTELLVKNTQDSYLKYSKSRLNHAYLQKSISDKILNVMYGIELKKE
jgi:hypothetical protein